jgi:hypothetical protein
MSDWKGASMLAFGHFGRFGHFFSDDLGVMAFPMLPPQALYSLPTIYGFPPIHAMFLCSIVPCFSLTRYYSIMLGVDQGW